MIKRVDTAWGVQLKVQPFGPSSPHHAAEIVAEIRTSAPPRKKPPVVLQVNGLSPMTRMLSRDARTFAQAILHLCGEADRLAAEMAAELADKKPRRKKKS